jgi:hypothetical protein
MRSTFKNSLIISFLINFVFCWSTFGDDLCSYKYLEPSIVNEVKNNIYEEVNKTVLTFLEGRNITYQGIIEIPVKIFQEECNVDCSRSFISTSFSLLTNKNQTFCNSNNYKECDLNPKFEMFFHTNIVRDEEGIPIKKTCQIYATIYLNVVNITQNYQLSERTQIFGGYIPVHQWEIPVSNSVEEIY